MELRTARLWPTMDPFAELSAYDISIRFARARKDVKHTCTAGSYCSLVTNLDLLSKKAVEIQKRVVGLCLYCARNAEGAKECEECTLE